MISVEHIEKIGRKTVDEYHLIVDDVTLATSHCVSVPADLWTIVQGDAWRGVVSGRNNVDAALRKLVA
jgi:hypothetical protein